MTTPAPCAEHLLFLDTCPHCRAANFTPRRDAHASLMDAPQHGQDLEDAARWLKLVVHLVPLGVDGPGDLAEADALAVRLKARAAAIFKAMPK